MKTEKEVTEWLEITAEVLVKENLKLFRDCAKPRGNSEYLARALVFIFIKKYISTLLDYAMTDYVDQGLEPNSPEEQAYTDENVSSFKTSLTRSICIAFEDAWAKNFNTYTDYYCTIAPTGNPVNKEIC